jgi:hypothetical protein
MSKHDPFDSRSERKARDYEVGYGKPPKSTRFQPRQSGNPSGRSKARASYAALTRLDWARRSRSVEATTVAR